MENYIRQLIIAEMLPIKLWRLKLTYLSADFADS